MRGVRPNYSEGENCSKRHCTFFSHLNESAITISFLKERFFVVTRSFVSSSSSPPPAPPRQNRLDAEHFSLLCRNNPFPVALVTFTIIVSRRRSPAAAVGRRDPAGFFENRDEIGPSPPSERNIAAQFYRGARVKNPVVLARRCSQPQLSIPIEKRARLSCP